MIRDDWCVAAGSGTILVTCISLACSHCANDDSNAVHVVLAICVCYGVSMFGFMLRAFCRPPQKSAMYRRPIRSGVCAAMLGGTAYGICVAIGLTIALCYWKGLTSGIIPVSYWLIYQLAVILVCTFAAVPLGFVCGTVFSFQKWRRAEESDEPKESRTSECG